MTGKEEGVMVQSLLPGFTWTWVGILAVTLHSSMTSSMWLQFSEPHFFSWGDTCFSFTELIKGLNGILHEID